MGLYHIQLKRDAPERIRGLMTSLGLPVTRLEERQNGTYYFYEDPKRKREVAFWVSASGSEFFWNCGLSSDSQKIAKGFSEAGLFVEK